MEMTLENKNEEIEKSLEILLKQLEYAKRKELKYNLDFGGDLNFVVIYSLDEGIKNIENNEFDSVNDFQSIKELININLFFEKNYILNKFLFPNYKKYVDDNLLSHAVIDIQLDNLKFKSNDLIMRGHTYAAREIDLLIFHLRTLNKWYFVEGKIDGEDYKQRALKTINDSKPILEQHRGYKKIVGNLILFILTLGAIFIIKKAITGEFLFFQKTDSAKQIKSITENINNSIIVSSPSF